LKLDENKHIISLIIE